MRTPWIICGYVLNVQLLMWKVPQIWLDVMHAITGFIGEFLKTHFVSRVLRKCVQKSF